MFPDLFAAVTASITLISGHALTQTRIMSLEADQTPDQVRSWLRNGVERMRLPVA